ncbi:hypothetical protein [Acidovorax sp. sif1233]|uniref:hypothetical protein n=1 Tax=Acidovorax sp. sif1233 TaxID=2854792 RepID=UPI0021038E6D|nr:hypothetical protein [Acidovorax sp. sif1233]
MPYRHLFKALQWGLILFCLCFAMVGGTMAERLLELLQCQPHANPALRSCAWLPNALGLRLAPFLSAGGISDYPFVLLQNFWALIAVWMVALIATHRAARNAASTAALPDRGKTRYPGITGADAGRWASRAAFWVLLLGLAGFCMAFGTPILGNRVALEVLGALGCSPGTFDPFSSPCMSAPGFWTHRLAVYVIPLAGPLLAPVWLFMAFWDILLAWTLLTAAAYILQDHLSKRARRPAP